jgi:hypothetical protein
VAKSAINAATLLATKPGTERWKGRTRQVEHQERGCNDAGSSRVLLGTCIVQLVQVAISRSTPATAGEIEQAGFAPYPALRLWPAHCVTEAAEGRVLGLQ